MQYIETLNFILAICCLMMMVVTAALYVDYFIFKGKYLKDRVAEASWFATVGLTVGSVVMSLTYSEYFGFIPCSLCWLQRIAIYPQALMSLIAFKTNDVKNFTLYGIGLSIFGLGVALYQYAYQMLPKETLTEGALPCLLDGSGADCADKVINEFGFITFPFISAVTFALLIIIYLYMRREA